MDKIKLNKMQFYGYHGLFSEEKKLGQRFYVDLELCLPLQQPGRTDAMEDSIDYGRAFELVKGVIEGEPKNLIEAVAEAIADQLFDEFLLLHACIVSVTKPNPPIDGHYESVAVEIYRERLK